jgi:predicted nucleotidyltransferase
MISIDVWNGGEADVAMLRRCRGAIRQVVPDADVILYGSRARRQAHEYSDYDVLVVVDGVVDMALKENILAQVYPLQLDTGALLTLMPYSRKQWDSPLHRATPFHRNVDREGVIL